MGRPTADTEIDDKDSQMLINADDLQDVLDENLVPSQLEPAIPLSQNRQMLKQFVSRENNTN